MEDYGVHDNNQLTVTETLDRLLDEFLESYLFVNAQ